LNKARLKDILPSGDFAEQIDLCDKLGSLQGGTFVAGGFASKILENHLTGKPLPVRQPVDVGWELVRASHSFSLSKGAPIEIEERHFEQGMQLLLKWHKNPPSALSIDRNIFGVSLGAIGVLNRELKEKISLLGLLSEELDFVDTKFSSRSLLEMISHFPLETLRHIERIKRLLKRVQAGEADESPILARAIFAAGDEIKGLNLSEKAELARDPSSMFERILSRISYGVIPHGELLTNRNFLAVVCQPSNQLVNRDDMLFAGGAHIPPTELKEAQVNLVSEGLVKNFKRFPDVDIFFETPGDLKAFESRAAPFISGKSLLDGKRLELRLSTKTRAKKLFGARANLEEFISSTLPRPSFIQEMTEGKISTIAEQQEDRSYGSERAPAISIYLADDSHLEPFEVQIVDWSARSGLKAEQQIEHFDNERSKAFVRRENDGELWLHWTDGAEKDIREGTTTFTAIASGPYAPMVAKRLVKFPNIVIPERTLEVFTQTAKAVLFSQLVTTLADGWDKESAFLTETKSEIARVLRKAEISKLKERAERSRTAFHLSEEPLILSWLASKPEEFSVAGRFTKVMDSFHLSCAFDFRRLKELLVSALEKEEAHEIFAHIIATTVLGTRIMRTQYVPSNLSALDFYLRNHAEGHMHVPFSFGFSFSDLDDPALENPCAKAVVDALQIYKKIIADTSEGVNLSEELRLRFRGIDTSEKFFWRPMSLKEESIFDDAMQGFFKAINYDDMINAILEELRKGVGDENLASVNSAIRKIRAFQRENVRNILKLK